MREILNRIKRGELQLYLTLVEAYLKQVYFSVKDDFTDEEAVSITKDIFVKLYDKVLSYIFIFNAQNYVDNNLEKIALKKGVILKKKYLKDTREVPEKVLRHILLGISAKTNTKKRRSLLIAVPIVSLIFLIGITFMAQVSSSNDTHPKGTIRRIENQVEVVYKQKLNYESEKITNIYKLDNQRVVLEKVNDTKYYYSIHNINEGMKGTIQRDKKIHFIKFANNKLIFKADNKLEMYNIDFELINSLVVNEEIILYSEENNFALYKGTDNYLMINLETFEVEKLDLDVSEKIIKIRNDGSFVTRSELYNQGYKEILNKDLYLEKLIDGKLVAISEEGILEVYDEGEVLFSKQLAHYQDLEQKQTHDYGPYMRTKLYNNKDYLIIPIRSRSNANFEIYDIETGKLITALADTLRSGDHDPNPVISDDGKAFLLATQYKTRREALRFNAVYDLSTIPIKEYHLKPVGHIEVMEIIGEDDFYYVYSFDDTGYFKIFRVKFVNS